MSFSEQQNPRLNIVVALSCEAKPLVDFYRLKKQQTVGFSYFTRKADKHQLFDISLVVSGIGANNMASACGWLGAKSNKNCVWLNVGIVGSKNHKLGEIVRIIQVSEFGSDKNHYPPLISKWSGINSSLISYTEACVDYPIKAVVDMEGSAFFSSSSKFSSSELIQSLKVISDNLNSNIDNLNSRRISELLSEKLKQINLFVTELIDLIPQTVNLPAELTEFEHLHSTVSQLHQYHELSEMLINIGIEKPVLIEKLLSAKSMQELLIDLRSIQQSTAPNLSMCEYS